MSPPPFLLTKIFYYRFANQEFCLIWLFVFYWFLWGLATLANWSEEEQLTLHSWQVELLGSQSTGPVAHLFRCDKHQISLAQLSLLPGSIFLMPTILKKKCPKERLECSPVKRVCAADYMDGRVDRWIWSVYWLIFDFLLQISPQKRVFLNLEVQNTTDYRVSTKCWCPNGHWRRSTGTSCLF